MRVYVVVKYVLRHDIVIDPIYESDLILAGFLASYIKSSVQMLSPATKLE